MSLKQTIMEAITASMKARTKERTSALRLIKADIQRIEVDQQIEVDDALVIDILSKMLKQRRDSISQFEAAGRQELADQEISEMAIIQEFLPTPLTEDEINALVAKAIEETDASDMKDMGKVMAILKPQLQGRADIGSVSKNIKQAFSS